jgi:uncharacterized membrane protein required for colicin V production
MTILGILTIVIMLIAGYAALREGAFTAFTMFVSVMLASVIACNFFEPLATLLDDMTAGSVVEGYEDFAMLILLFSVTLMLLRYATNNLSPTFFSYHPTFLYLGGALFGLLTGYIVSGFLVVAMQTLPLHENFMGFEAEIPTNGLADPADASGIAKVATNDGLRSLFPPDRVWLAMMHRESYGGLGRYRRDEHKGFDANCNFPLRYERYRRFGEVKIKRDPLEYDYLLVPEPVPIAPVPELPPVQAAPPGSTPPKP